MLTIHKSAAAIMGISEYQVTRDWLEFRGELQSVAREDGIKFYQCLSTVTESASLILGVSQVEVIQGFMDYKGPIIAYEGMLLYFRPFVITKGILELRNAHALGIHE